MQCTGGSLLDSEHIVRNEVLVTMLCSVGPILHPDEAARVKVKGLHYILSSPHQFDRWSDGQRKAVLQDLVLSSSVEQLTFLSVSVSGLLPLQAADFTCLLPRALSLYIFSFLDPRSLCRCAQVRRFTITSSCSCST